MSASKGYSVGIEWNDSGEVVRIVNVPDDPDPRRKHYELTDLGRAVVRAEAERIVELGRALESYRWSGS